MAWRCMGIGMLAVVANWKEPPLARIDATLPVPVLKLPPVKRAIAAKALNSRYLDTLIAKKTV